MTDQPQLITDAYEESTLDHLIAYNYDGDQDYAQSILNELSNLLDALVDRTILLTTGYAFEDFQRAYNSLSEALS